MQNGNSAGFCHARKVIVIDLMIPYISRAYDCSWSKSTLNEGQFPLLASMMVFIVAFMGGLCWMCGKYIKQRDDMDNEQA